MGGLSEHRHGRGGERGTIAVHSTAHVAVTHAAPVWPHWSPTAPTQAPGLLSSAPGLLSPPWQTPATGTGAAPGPQPWPPTTRLQQWPTTNRLQ